MQPVTALTIAGSDSGGGAGIQADLRTFSAFQVHGTCAITALTAQNTLGVTRVWSAEPSLVIDQARAVLDDFAVVAVKTGMLAQPSTVEAVAELARAGELKNLVVDPVLVSSTGHDLMSNGGALAYRESLLPYALLVTPNLREAAVLCDIDVRDITSIEDMVQLGQVLLEFGPQSVLVKGGHFIESSVTSRHAPDILLHAGEIDIFDAPRVATRNDHGTGCSLSAAITAGLGLGRPLHDATRDAKSFVLAALEGAASWNLGRGHGPIDHLGWQSE
ncbi:MAG: bifunctional hydroxymethylpyrimidine kinase/phosphomethylpyrimidine kinase [Acidobacteria bacterium]|nr:bifunctional hydroxymethylpyrimidine kinase/phosphomethylpyrimidine kinase [Acidobacteriota bacterium]